MAAARTIEIQVQNDHLERLARVRKPILAVAELIWNAVDADAEAVDVVLNDDAIGELSEIVVTDNGHGMPYGDAEDLFQRLGGSWKRGGKRSRIKRRLLHVQEGRGRFRAFGLGRVVDWDVTYAAQDRLKQYRLTIIKDALRRVEIGEEHSAPKRRSLYYYLVKTWSQIVSDCRARLRFFSDKLNYAPDRDASIAHLQATYEKYLADLFSIEPVATRKGDLESDGI